MTTQEHFNELNLDNYNEYELISIEKGFIIYKHKICGTIIKKKKPIFRNAPQCNNSVCIQKRKKKTNLEKYGCENPSQNSLIKDKKKKTCLKHFGKECHLQSEEIKKRIKETNIKKYGCENVFQNEKIKEKSKLKRIKKYGCEYFSQTTEFNKRTKETNLEKYGCEYYSQTKEYINKRNKSNLEKFGYENPMQNKEVQEKMFKSMKTNNSFGKSKEEDFIYEFIKDYYPDIIRQYRSEIYPFNCDFYIPNLDLYIEYNGHKFSHWSEPFNPLNEEHLVRLNEMKEKNTDYYNNAINVWTVKDPIKRQTAKDNNLKYLEIWDYDLKNILKEIERFK